MTVGLAALAWHLRNEFLGRQGPRIAVGLGVLCALNVVLLFPGRSAQVALLVTLVVLVLALFWAVPPRARPVAILVPVLLIAKALDTANLADHVASLPLGIDTVVGHNATQLSGGSGWRSRAPCSRTRRSWS